MSQANVSGGWFGFGITEAGAMKGADIVYYQSSAPSVVTDAYSLDFITPTRDEIQDWTLLTASNDGGWLTVEVTRALDTQARLHNGKRPPFVYTQVENNTAVEAES